MANKSAKEVELEKRLQEAEEIISALRNEKVDEVIGTGLVDQLRLKHVEDQFDEQARIAADRLKEIETIYRNVPIGLCVLNRDLKFTRVNDHLARINGISADEHLGRSVAEIVPMLAGKVEDDLRRILETGKPMLNIHLSGETPAMPGVERHWLEHWLPLYNNQGEIIGINMVVEEITERKQFEDVLKKLNTTLEERVAERTKIAEDRAEKLREMALQMTRVEENERQRLARVLHDGLQQLLIGAKLIANTISKQLAGQDSISNQLGELNMILDQSIESSRSLSYDLSPPILNDEGLLASLHWLINLRHMQGLDVEIHAANELPDLSQNLMVFLFQVVRELLINVIKHAEVSQAQVFLSSDEQYICVEVIDQGKGFDVNEEITDSYGCQGLQNIRQKLDLMNGYLNIKSEPGSGSHFTIHVPYKENSDLLTAGRTAVKNPDGTPGSINDTDDMPRDDMGAIKILVVDDNEIMRSRLIRILEREPDFNLIGEAGTGVEAVDFVHKEQPEVILMDILMPDMDGIEATRQIHRKFPEIRIIGYTLRKEREYISQMEKAGASEYLNKGCSAGHLYEVIRRAKK